MVTKIALEEHFMCAGFEDYWQTTVADVDPAILGGIKVKVGSRLFDASLRAKLDSLKFALKRA